MQVGVHVRNADERMCAYTPARCAVRGRGLCGGCRRYHREPGGCSGSIAPFLGSSPREPSARPGGVRPGRRGGCVREPDPPVRGRGGSATLRRRGRAAPRRGSAAGAGSCCQDIGLCITRRFSAPRGVRHLLAKTLSFCSPAGRAGEAGQERKRRPGSNGASRALSP